jgi:nicotinamide-nucleotide amidase
MADDIVERIARAAGERGVTVAAAESLTSGLVASRLGAGPEASAWFRGGVVAYQETVKFGVLDVTEGPVVTERCAVEMARGVARLLGADVAVSVTGVGGPHPEEEQPPGTVFVGLSLRDDVTARRLDLDGDPEEILRQTADTALVMLSDLLTTGR